VPIYINSATIRSFLGHFARILVDIDLLEQLPELLLVEREDYALFCLYHV